MLFRSIDDLKTMLTPFLPFSCQKLHGLLGYDTVIAGELVFREETEDEGSSHVVLTGDYTSWVRGWQPGSLPVGQQLRQPFALFRKLDPEQVVADELARMEALGT